MAKKWIKDAAKGKDKMHERLGTPKGEKIPKKNKSTRSGKEARGAMYGAKD